MSPRFALPDQLGEAFSVRAAREAGVSEKRLRGPQFEVHFRGVRSRPVAAAFPTTAEAERDDAWRRIRAYSQIMPEHAFFVGPTAALIGGVPLPTGLHRDLYVGVEFPRTPPRRAGVRGRRVSTSGHTVTVSGLRVADPILTWATLGEHLGEYDLVAATDHIIRVPRSPGGLVRLTRTRPYATRERLEQILLANRWRAAPKLRRALARARTGASSRPETWTRLLIVDAGLPEPVLDHDIFDERGTFVACGDTAYPHLKVLIEYEGDGHRERAQFECDIDRYSDVMELDWRAVRLTSAHVFRAQSEVVRRVCAAAAFRTPIG